MRSQGTPNELERRRILAVSRLQGGYSTDEVARFLGVDARTVRRWWKQFQEAGWDGLEARSGAGRPAKLTPTQTKTVLRWLRDLPSEHGFATELWTAERLRILIQEAWGVEFNRRYLSAWLRTHGFTPQRPQRVPRERDFEAIAAWLASDWPRIKESEPAERSHRFSR